MVASTRSSTRSLETVGDAPRTWIGHSFGARLALEVAARAPELVPSDSCFSTPPSWMPAHVAAARRPRTPAASASYVVVRGGSSSVGTTRARCMRAPRELVDEELGGARRSEDDGGMALPLLPGRRRRRVRRDRERRRRRFERRPDTDAARPRRASRTCRTTISSTHTGPRSATCSRSSSCRGPHGSLGRVRGDRRRRSDPRLTASPVAEIATARRGRGASGGPDRGSRTSAGDVLVGDRRGRRRGTARPSSASSRVIVSGGTTMHDVPVGHQVQPLLEGGLGDPSDRRSRLADRRCTGRASRGSRGP